VTCSMSVHGTAAANTAIAGWRHHIGTAVVVTANAHPRYDLRRHRANVERYEPAMRSERSRQNAGRERGGGGAYRDPAPVRRVDSHRRHRKERRRRRVWGRGAGGAGWGGGLVGQ
jgi:hypothetical protein